MPSPNEILGGLTYIANSWSGVAIVWHIAIAVLLAALIAGWRPRRRLFSLILLLPLISVSTFAWLAQNPFNGTIFAVGAFALGMIGVRLPNVPVQQASNPVALLGLAMIAFGWVYPHFLDGGPAWRYLYAAPTGLVPCPTLSVIVGFALLAGGLQSLAWSLVLAAMGLFYGLFGAFLLGVDIDIGLIVGAVALAGVALQRGRLHGRQTVAAGNSSLMGPVLRHCTPVDAAEDLRGLPDPVQRYFKHVLAEGQCPIRCMRMSQTGILRTDFQRERWLRFQADQLVEPHSRRFSWDARVRILPFVHVRVRDTYAGGVGSGQVQLLSAVTVAFDNDKPELNAASLHRYLAEAVWYPTALLPSAGVQWRPIDDSRALATLTDAGTTVSLEFRFNDAGEIIAIYTPGRWCSSRKGYELKPWEGHFRDYRRHQGILVPARGEVGWYENGRLAIVWKGVITALEYEFEQV